MPRRALRRWILAQIIRSDRARGAWHGGCWARTAYRAVRSPLRRRTVAAISMSGCGADFGATFVLFPKSAEREPRVSPSASLTRPVPLAPCARRGGPTPRRRRERLGRRIRPLHRRPTPTQPFPRRTLRAICAAICARHAARRRRRAIRRRLHAAPAAAWHLLRWWARRSWIRHVRPLPPRTRLARPASTWACSTACGSRLSCSGCCTRRQRRARRSRWSRC